MKQSRVAHVASIVFLVLAIGLTPAALAGRGGGKGGNCARNVPDVFIDNNWGWSSWGSWGMPGSSFVINMSTPDGFSVSMPTTTIGLRSSTTSDYLWAYVTSPSAIADG